MNHEQNQIRSTFDHRAHGVSAFLIGIRIFHGQGIGIIKRQGGQFESDLVLPEIGLGLLWIPCPAQGIQLLFVAT
ncbi:hypothetical protein AZA_18292 [Nitrospirillum viridazoti Y2]|nr:hypothetical protein AZA_18292 [Nitrospirillum amazonense Y2]